MYLHNNYLNKDSIGFVFIPAIFSHTGQIHKSVMELMFSQIKHKLELDDPEVQSSKIKGMLNLWVKQLSCVINRTASRIIMTDLWIA